jgi:hypothetical protein
MTAYIKLNGNETAGITLRSGKVFMKRSIFNLFIYILIFMIVSATIALMPSAAIAQQGPAAGAGAGENLPAGAGAQPAGGEIITIESVTEEVCVLNIGRATDEVFFPLSEESHFESDGPSSFAIDKDGKIYILDTFNFKVIIVSEGKIVKTFNYPESETAARKYFVRDIAVSPVDGKIYLLNHTLKNIFIYSNEGVLLGDINIAEEVVGPHKITVSAAGEIIVRDEDEAAIVIYSKDGKFKSRTEGAYTAPLLNGDGYLYALGEFDSYGRDVILTDPMSARDAKQYARIFNKAVKLTAFDYQIIGTDAEFNLFAIVIEQPEFDKARPVVSKFDKSGKLLSRFNIGNFWGIGLALPARQYAISPAGGFYAFDIDSHKNKFYIYKISELKDKK